MVEGVGLLPRPVLGTDWTGRANSLNIYRRPGLTASLRHQALHRPLARTRAVTQSLGPQLAAKKTCNVLLCTWLYFDSGRLDLALPSLVRLSPALSESPSVKPNLHSAARPTPLPPSFQ